MEWIDKDEKILNDEDHEKVYMDKIGCFFVFIDMENNILKVNKECVDLEVNAKENCSILRKDVLLKHIQTQKNDFDNSSFIYKYATSYLFEYDHNDIIDCIQNDDDFEAEMKSIPLMDDIVIGPSICIFHDVNCLYFIFEQERALKPILKIHELKKVVPSKRVTIKLSKKQKMKSRKNYNRLL